MKGSNKTGCPFLFISFSWQLFRVFTPQFKPSLLQSLPTALQDLPVLSHYNLIDCTVRTSQQTSQFHLVCRNFVFSKANSQFYPYLILNWKEYFTSDVFLLNQIYLAKPLSLSLLWSAFGSQRVRPFFAYLHKVLIFDIYIFKFLSECVFLQHSWILW